MVHSFYRSQNPSGENNVVLAQVELLRSAGHEVLLVSRDSDDMDLVGAIKAGVRVATGRGASPLSELRAFGPDIVHVHNLFPNFGTSWLRRWPGALVATLHNYRTMCANGLLFRDGVPCTLCPTRGSRFSMRYRCYRDSAAATLPLTIKTHGGLQADPLVRRADRIIVLSPRARQVFTTFGVPEGAMVLIPNGISDPTIQVGTQAPQGWAIVGRLDVEKGFPDVIRRWPAGEKLTVWGSGPFLDVARAEAGPMVDVRGQVPAAEFRPLLSTFEGVIFAGSAWEGGVPMVVLESLAAGVPLVARRGGAAAEIVARYGCGSVFDTDPVWDIRQALAEVRARRSELGPISRRVFEAHFTDRQWLHRLVGLYGELAARGSESAGQRRSRGDQE